MISDDYELGAMVPCEVEAHSVTAGRAACLGENLIFVISQPRAGSTMLQKMLGACPDVHTVSEPWIALPLLFALRETGVRADYNSVLARMGIEELLKGFPEGEEAYWEAARRFLNHLYRRALGVTGKRIFVDKTPRYYFVIPELRRVFPHARFVFLLRNPLAVFASVLKTWVRSENVEQLRDMRWDLAAAPSLLMEGIRSCGTDAIVVRYEELTSDPETVMRRLSSQLGLTFHPAMVEYGAASNGERWAFGDQGTVYREVRPQPRYADAWLSVLKVSPLWEGWASAYIEALGPDLVRDLGYDYAQLRAALMAPPANEDWLSITQSEDDARKALDARLQQVTGVVREQEQQLKMMEQQTAERLKEMLRKDGALAEITVEAERRQNAIAEITAEAERRQNALDAASRSVQELEARIAVLEAERLAESLRREATVSRRLRRTVDGWVASLRMRKSGAPQNRCDG
jgi:hypothetical protein